MRYLIPILGAVALIGAAAGARATVVAGSAVESSSVPATFVAQKSDKKKAAKTNKKAKGKQKAKGGESQVLDLSAPPANAATPAPATSAPVLDLSTADTNSEAARQELLQGAPAAPDEPKGKKKKGSGEGFDFGGGADVSSGGGDFDFGEVQLDLGTMDKNTPERERFERALALMSDENYATASLEFRYFLDDPKFEEFVPESQYQLAKALYKLGFLDTALERFKQILDKGPAHRRYKKSVEWLFFISRKMADETPVLAELARFRNVTFPKAYQNEYRYLLAKYLFAQANDLEVMRLQEEELARRKKEKTATLDFGAVAEAVKSGNVEFDFSSVAASDEGGGFNFGGEPAKGKKGKGGDGGFDFGGGSSGGGSGGGGDSSGFDFGGGASGGMDFGGAAADGQAATDAPVRDGAPTTAKEALRQGLELIGQVDDKSRFYAKSKYLEGLLLYLDGADQKAVSAFQEVVRVLNPRGGALLDPKLREMAFLSLARIHYGYKQFDRSAYYYDQIDRDSENWLTALFEASWAYYQRGDFEKALGNLLTLHSPFFEREYFPESQLVKAIIYFEACRYGETRTIVDDFIQRFTQVMQEIQRIAESKDAPERLYDQITGLLSGGDKDDVTARVVSLALADPEIRRARDVVTQINEQLELWKQMPDVFRQSRLGEETREALQKLTVARAQAAGEVTRQKFERELYSLKSLLGQAVRVKLEVVRAEREVLEAKMRGEATNNDIVPATARTVVDDEHLYWPYEGEYWRDELGTYELDFSMCRPLAASAR